jgi:tripartite-type tricarboxylate transporter receptor subunit TctC
LDLASKMPTSVRQVSFSWEQDAHRKKTMKSLCLLLLPALGIASFPTGAQAQPWPAKPIRAIIAAGAGSTIDIIPRIVFEQLSLQLGQSIVVENRGGAGGTIAASFVARAEPDGYTFLVHSNGHTISPSLYDNLSYHPSRDFAAVVPIGVLPNVLVVAPDKGFKTVTDLSAAAKAKPGALNFSSVGVGSATHMSAERFRASAGISAVHIPFKGGAEAMSEVMAGRVDFFFGPVGLVLPHVKENKLVALVVNGAERSAALPDVPTTAEAGFRNAEYPFWIGIFLPVSTPRDVVEKLNRETLKALQEPKVREKLASLGVDPMVMTPPDMDVLIRREIDLNAELVKSAGITGH